MANYSVIQVASGNHPSHKEKEMLLEEVSQVVRNAVDGSRSRKVKITFKRQSMDDLRYLMMMHNNGEILLSASDEITLLAIVTSHNWSGDRNRTVVVAFSMSFDENLFVDRMHRGLEKIEVAK